MNGWLKDLDSRTYNVGHWFSLLSIIVIDTMTKSNLEEEMIYFIFISRWQYSIRESQDKNSRKSRGRKHGGKLDMGLFFMACSAFFH